MQVRVYAGIAAVLLSFMTAGAQAELLNINDPAERGVMRGLGTLPMAGLLLLSCHWILTAAICGP